MKMVRVYAAVFVACFLLGATFVLLAPEQGLATKSPCNPECYVYFDCGPLCPQEKYPNQVYYGYHYSDSSDHECAGPFTCSTTNSGCHICQP